MNRAYVVQPHIAALHGVCLDGFNARRAIGAVAVYDAPDDAVIAFDAGPAKLTFTLGEVRSEDLRWDFGGLDQRVTASTLHTDGENCDTEFAYVDEHPGNGEQAYWVRVVQTDFHRAWSSPIYVKTNGG